VERRRKRLSFWKPGSLEAWKHRISFSGSPPTAELRVRSSESDSIEWCLYLRL
jgi:hypothetical protein